MDFIEQLKSHPWHTSLQKHAMGQQLLRCIKEDRLPQLLLLHGPSEEAVLQMSWQLVAALHCETGVGCGICQRCLDFRNHRDPEILCIYEATIKRQHADLVHEHLQFRSQSPTGRRVVLLMHADHCTTGAANSLLKICEEPPQGSQIVMTTTRIRSVIPTLRSRAVPIMVQKVGTEQLLQQVKELGGSSRKFQENELQELARISQYSIAELSELLKDDQHHFFVTMDFFRKLFSHATYAESMTQAKNLTKSLGVSAEAIVSYTDIFLNLVYRDSPLLRQLEVNRKTVLKKMQPTPLRQLLTKSRQAIIRKIPLNSLLLLESIVIATHQGTKGEDTQTHARH